MEPLIRRSLPCGHESGTIALVAWHSQGAGLDSGRNRDGPSCFDRVNRFALSSRLAGSMRAAHDFSQSGNGTYASIPAGSSAKNPLESTIYPFSPVAQALRVMTN